jgi:cellulose synthase/poly-beta-1,6-N-acetylglucosamine synthase-like glycosyltransferase
MDQARVDAMAEPVDPTPRPADSSPFPAVAPETDSAAGSGKPLLSVVIPCYNEVATIASLIERVRLAPVPSKQIIVVDDGSSDGTRDLLAGLQADDLTILFTPTIRARERPWPPASLLP